MNSESHEVQDRHDQPRASVENPSLTGLARAFGVTIGPSLLLDVFAAGSTLAVITGQIRRPKRGIARLLRALTILGAVLPGGMPSSSAPGTSGGVLRTRRWANRCRATNWYQTPR